MGKRALALALLLLGGAAMFTDAGYVASDNAVVSAHLVTLRAPIGGIVDAFSGTVGAPVAAGSVIMRIVDPAFDDRPVTAIRDHLARLLAERDAVAGERTALLRLLADLRDRAEQYRLASVVRLGLEAARARQDLAAKTAEAGQAHRELRRKSALDGTVPQADIERTQAAADIADRQVEALTRLLGAAEAGTRAAENGIMVEANSSTDVPYSGQRADEVRLRLTELERRFASLSAEISEMEARGEAERHAADRLREATAVAPSETMVWRASVAVGELVAPGALLAQLVDCRTAFLAVSVPQKAVPDIDTAAAVTFRLAGERQDRTGRITAIVGGAALSGDATVVAAPASGAAAVATVFVSMPPSGNDAGACPVGRTARALLPTANEAWLDQMVRIWGGLPSRLGL